MALEAIKKIAINFAVVFIVASVFSSVAPGTARNAFAFFEDKLGFGEPSIGYFTVTLNENGEAWSMKYSILGNLKDAEEVVISKRYSEDAGALPSGKFDDVKTLKGGEVNDWNGKPITDVKIDVEKHGWYEFLLEVSLTNGDVINDDALTGFYDEEYVETEINTPLEGCGPRGGAFEGCNVIGCKKAIMNYWLEIVNFDVAPAIFEILTEDVMPAGSCATFDPYAIPELNFDECEGSEVDAINTRFARIRLLKLFNSLRGVTSELEYGNYPDDLDGLKQAAVEDSLACSHGQGSFAGVYAFLDGSGWHRLPKGSELKEWESKIREELPES